MLSAQWAHRLLLWIGLSAIVCVALYAGIEGWLDWVLPGTQNALVSLVKPLADRLPSFETVDRFARVLGATGTAITAAFGVYTGLYYARRNLPQRLREYLARTDERLLRDRAPLLAAIFESRPGVNVEKSVFYVRPLNRALRELGFSRLPSADEALQEALRELDEQIATSNAQTRSMEEQKVAAHILRGSIASARAEGNAKLGKSPDADRDTAEQEFAWALEVRPNDLDALELRGRQRDLRGNESGALADFEGLANAADKAGMPIRAAGGYRYQAKIFEQRGTPTALRDSRRRLSVGLETINSIGSLTQEALFEKGCLHEAYAQVQIKQNHLPSARQHLNDAIRSFGSIAMQAARDHERDAKDALRSITPLEADDRAAKAGWLRRFLMWVRRLLG